ncbi:hypothetical protein [uncultured Corynebacterium sp.]|uniref:hypothetical protein n=1 Tax=uncultured Corynebacterium sp. TaxID=159447 RepID=UPI00345BB2FF
MQKTVEPNSEVHRGLEVRHMVMLALGGVIGSGLFISSGYTITQAGPLGAVLAYLIGAAVAWMVNMGRPMQLHIKDGHCPVPH